LEHVVSDRSRERDRQAMNRKDFYKLYEEWLHDVNMDAYWFEHRLDEITGDVEPFSASDKAIYSTLTKIGKVLTSARDRAEYLSAQVSPGIRIGESMRDEPLPVPTVTELPAKLRELRKYNKWKLIDVAQMTGLSPSFLSDVERGVTSPSFDTLQKLADVYCTPITFQVAPVVGAPKENA